MMAAIDLTLDRCPLHVAHETNQRRMLSSKQLEQIGNAAVFWKRYAGSRRHRLQVP